MAKFFNYSIKRKDLKARQAIEDNTFVDRRKDAAEVRVAGGIGAGRELFHFSLDPSVRNEFDLISIYRRMAKSQETSLAIEEICNEMVVNDETNQPVEINLDNVDESVVDSSTKKKILEEFDIVLKLLNFNISAYDIVNDWYVDSRIVFHKVLGKNGKDGIKELRQMDPKQVIKVVEVEQQIIPSGETSDGRSVILEKPKDEYYVYTPQKINDNNDSGFGTSSTYYGNFNSLGLSGAITVSVDEICYVSSGLHDEGSGITYGYLQKAVRSWNQLSLLEDAMVVYRLSRASEKKAYYVDTGNMNPRKAKEYVENVKNGFRNDVVYDTQTGTLVNKKRVLAMQEDLWLSRREGSRGTEIQTLDGAQNLGEIDDIIYLRDKHFNSLNVPKSRFQDDVGSVMLGRQTEVARDELKFGKFISRLRKRFNLLFNDILSTQLSVKGILSLEEFEKIVNDLQYKYNQDSYYSEVKDIEVLDMRLDMLEKISDKIGTYFSHDYARTKILGQTQDEQETIDKQNATESKDPRYKQTTEEENF